jgi:2,3-bisphosphoglycerate-independent phosphoglycerate mutase
VPVLLYHKAVRADDARRLTEQECVRGALGHINGVDVLKLILDYCDKSHMFGE